MKNILRQSLILTGLLILLFSFIYPLIVSAIAIMAPGKGDGVVIQRNGKVVGYELIGQKFTEDKYFWGRPSAVDYNASGSGGSNKGPTNPEYLKMVQDRIDTFLVHNPNIKKQEIPAELLTASGSGLDPDISVKSAYIQIPRISKVRNMPEAELKALVDKHAEKPLFGLFGPAKVNVLKLNIGLEEVSK